MMGTAVTMDNLVAGYVARRERIRTIEADTKARIAPLKKEMELIEAAMTKLMDEAGTLSVRTSHGTAFVQTWTSVKVVDGEAFINYVVTQKRYDLLPRQANKSAVLDSPEPVAGVAVERGRALQVRTSGKETADDS